jgi:hypothetical protein
MLGWLKRGQKAEPEEEDPIFGRRSAERLQRLAATIPTHLEPPPPPPPVILLLEPPNYRREFISRFPWNGGISPYEPVEEVKRRVPRDKRDLRWWER